MIAFDLDGTLFEHVGKVDWLNGPELLRATVPRPGAMSAVQDLLRSGADVRVVTNRDQRVAQHTLARLHGFSYAPLPPLTAYFRPEWMHWGSAREYKANVLKGLGRGVYVGDRRDDEAAARDAGWKFVHADDWLASPEIVYDLAVLA